MTRKELLAVPAREWNEPLHNVTGVYVIPSRRKHESGYACMDFVAEFHRGERPMVRFGGCTDSVAFCGANFQMDCTYPHGIIRIWSWKPFSVSSDLSSIYFREEKS